MVLSDVDICGYTDINAELIHPFQMENVQAASYDLSIGNEITEFKRKIRTVDLSDQDTIDCIYKTVEIPGDGYVLEPGEYIMAAMKERINLPAKLTAHIRPRTRFVRVGILTSAQHINPGYSGNLQIGIFNASPNAVILRAGLKMCQIVFEEVKTVPSKEKQYQNKKNAAYMNEEQFRGGIFDTEKKEELSPRAKQMLDELLNDFKREK